ncbi:MAG: hypothetical protein R6W92_12050, partial [Desulfocurvibacter africanus]
KRKANSVAFRQSLIDAVGAEPRCYLCGYKFEEEAVKHFLEGKEYNRKPKSFVDYLRPHGLDPRDFRVELDHVFPFSLGGRNGENLRIACGWCNRFKSNKISLFESSSYHKSIDHPYIGRTSIPKPFWSIRLIATRGRCEHMDGCNKTIKNAHLTIAPLHTKGAMLPTNIVICCSDHDPLPLKTRMIHSRFLK